MKNPIYKVDDKVVFLFNDEEEIKGTIFIVDARGTFGQNEEPSYDIYGNDGCLYKHVKQSSIVKTLYRKR